MKIRPDRFQGMHLRYWRLFFRKNGRLITFSVAQRIVDDVPRAIDTDVIRPLATEMLPHLLKGLNINGEGGGERARMFLSEDSSITSQREDLKRKQKRLENARASLKSFGLICLKNCQCNRLFNLNPAARASLIA